eukprot:SAG22_NODE_1161_length_5307_cov_55.889593_4_plen_90_part_00
MRSSQALSSLVLPLGLCLRQCLSLLSVCPGSGGDRVARLPRNQSHVDILMYIMHHYPGNTVKSWKRQLFGDLVSSKALPLCCASTVVRI